MWSVFKCGTKDGYPSKNMNHCSFKGKHYQRDDLKPSLSPLPNLPLIIPFYQPPRFPRFGYFAVYIKGLVVLVGIGQMVTRVAAACPAS